MRIAPPVVGDTPAPTPVPTSAPPSRPLSGLRVALGDTASVGLAFVPIGLAFGALVTQSGIDWWWASLSAALIYAGSFEFLLIGMVAAAVPLASIAATAFMVNVRHVFYALSYPLHRVQGRLGKAYGTFALSDEAYALTSGEKARSWPGPRIIGLQLLLHLYWVGGATAGALLGSLIPEGVTGLDFALTALFTVLAVDAVRDLRGDLPTPLLALLSALFARLLFPGELLLAAFALFTLGLLVRHLATGRRPGRA
ncbi:branched-chain amino acid ABC transporter permease [Streptomyces kanamyceticus]|uniref:Branched-chain amino acid ABC transporter permease n=1 Tax=Streptomyces kanamyceticus TaxID=1967 RepID=A0A5J6G3W7_STRKN|nr:AzlC family ABC transporter permease [Streptomyces kanamyceticus]QEU90300.1 branched-chain amino acid ABC transporter permease [Streptomyces kanamyceticus]